MKRHVAFIVMTAMPWLMASCSSAAEPTTQPLAMSADEIAHLRDIWADYCIHHPGCINSYGERTPEESEHWLAILQAYYQEIVQKPYDRGELYFVVQDEQGRPLDGVTCEVRYISANPNLFGIEPNVDRKPTIFINGEKRLPWPREAFSIELSLSAYKCRSIQVNFSVNTHSLRDMMEAGHELPPATDGGPIRVVMPPALVWDPPAYKDGVSATNSPDKDKWPTTLPANLKVVARSDPPTMALAPVRGTYVLVDGHGSVVWITQLDQYMSLGFLYETSAFDWGESRGVDRKDGPYEWRLYSTPKPAKGP